MIRGAVGMGLYLMKAQAIHARPIAERGQGRKSSATVALDSAVQGFDQWINENLAGLEISRRSCYNYMNAARNCGLHADSTDEDVAQLDLAGRKAKELYAGADAPAPKPLPPVTEGHAAEQLWLPLWDDMHRYAAPEGPEAKALWKLPVVSADPKQPSLEALEIKLRATLDLITEVKTARAKSRR